MAENSSIEWTTHTFNPWRGCTKVSPGCAHCYAETLSGRNPGTLGKWGPNGTRVIAAEAQWNLVRKWDREAAIAARRDRVFCASLADVFEGPETMPSGSVTAVHAARARLFNLIAQTPDLTWLLLTKRPHNWRSVLGHAWNVSPTHGGPAGVDLIADWLEGKPPANVWMGASVENQDAADERIPHLIATPAAVRLLSCEPLLSPVNLDGWLGEVDGEDESGCPTTAAGVDWVIVGGESGTKARPMHPNWARWLRDQCQAAGVPFFFKQWGEYAPHRDGFMQQVGKKKAGRLLDGREWSEVPA